MFPRMVVSLIATLLVGCGEISQSVQKETPKMEQTYQPQSGNSTAQTSIGQPLENNPPEAKSVEKVVYSKEKISKPPLEEKKIETSLPKEKEKKTNPSQGEKKPTIPKEVNKKTLTEGEKVKNPYEENIKKVALLVIAKSAPVVITENNLLFEGTLNKKQPLKGCSVVTVKVKDKNSKREEDYLVTVCGKQINIELKKEK
jgi:hypothetical protein